MLPPGDLRMALAALCGDDDWGTTWSRVVQTPVRRGRGAGRPLGWEPADRRAVDLLGDPVAGLDWVGRLLRVRGRVLPMAAVPLDIVAVVEGVDPARPEDVRQSSGARSRAR